MFDRTLGPQELIDKLTKKKNRKVRVATQRVILRTNEALANLSKI